MTHTLVSPSWVNRLMYFTSFPFLTTTIFLNEQGRTYTLSCFPSQEKPITSGLVVTLFKLFLTPVVSLTKICNHFWFAKHFVNYFLFFLRSFFSSLKSNPGGTRTHNHMDCGLNAACIPIPPPDHFNHYVKEPFSFVSQRYWSFWNYQTIKHKKTPLFWRGVLNVICI